jgi:hypothetical protein
MFVGIAAEIGIHCRHKMPCMLVAYIDAHDQNERGDLCAIAAIEIRPELLREAHVAATAGLQIAVVRRSIDWRNIEPLELAGLSVPCAVARPPASSARARPWAGVSLAVVDGCTAAFMIGAILAYHPSRGSSRRGPAGGET